MNDSDAKRFELAYTSVRAREHWAERDRKRHSGVIRDAVELMRRELGAHARLVDVGAGGAGLPGVITIDLLPVADVMADMRALPLPDGDVDGVLYAASLHYAPVRVAIAEAARILRGGGLFVAVDSPIYSDRAAAAAAKERSDAYYVKRGVPLLAEHYHPIDAGALRDALLTNGFEVARLSMGSRWGRLLRRGPRSFVLARKLR